MNSNKTAPKVEPARHWINDEWISSSNLAESVSPSTGELLGQYSAGGRVEAAAAIAAARKAFDTGGWSHDPQLRSRALLELADRPDERADAIALTITQALHCTILTMGADRILFSNDYPYEDYAEGGEFIDTVPISESDRRKIAYDNAKALYKL